MPYCFRVMVLMVIQGNLSNGSNCNFGSTAPMVELLSFFFLLPLHVFTLLLGSLSYALRTHSDAATTMRSVAMLVLVYMKG